MPIRDVAPHLGILRPASRRTVQDRSSHDGGQHRRRCDGRLPGEPFGSALHGRRNGHLPAHRHHGGCARAAQRCGRRADQPGLGGPDRTRGLRAPAQGPSRAHEPGAAVPLDRGHPRRSESMARGPAAPGPQWTRSRWTQPESADLGQQRRALRSQPGAGKHALGPRLHAGRIELHPCGDVRRCRAADRARPATAACASAPRQGACARTRIDDAGPRRRAARRCRLHPGPLAAAGCGGAGARSARRRARAKKAAPLRRRAARSHRPTTRRSTSAA